MKNIGLRWVLPAMILAFAVPAAYAENGTEHSKDVEAKIAYCKKCHGQMGQGIGAAYSVPRLAGQTIPYLEAKFGIISEHKRDNTTAETFMVPVLGSVDPQSGRPSPRISMGSTLHRRAGGTGTSYQKARSSMKPGFRKPAFPHAQAVTVRRQKAPR